MRISTLGRRGDFNAPPGSTDWSIAMRREICLLLDRHEVDYKRLQRLIGNLQQQKGWAALSDENDQPFASFEAFCLAREPFGLGYHPADIEQILSGVIEPDVDKAALQLGVQFSTDQLRDLVVVLNRKIADRQSHEARRKKTMQPRPTKSPPQMLPSLFDTTESEARLKS